MTKLLNKIMDVATIGGQRDLLDTPEEIDEARALLVEEYAALPVEAQRAQAILAHAFATIDRHPNAAFRIVSPHFADAPLCTEETIQDCFAPLVPITAPMATVFPVRSGAMFANYTDYRFFTNEEWAAIIAPLAEPAATVEEELRQLDQAVDRFDEAVAPNDWPGFLGNVIPMRGEQDCTDELATLVPFLSALTANDLLRHLALDPEDDGVHMGTFHHAVKLKGRDGTEYVVDPWEFHLVVERETWELHYGVQRDMWYGPKI